MACRIGMSKTPHARIAYWKRTEGHTHSAILAKGLTYDRALAKERAEAATRNCNCNPGGDPGADRHRYVWSVYHVWGGRTRI